MSVIGRLDSQVDDLLISPLSKRHEQTRGAHEKVPATGEPPRPADETPHDDAVADNQSTHESRELPIWML